MAEYWSSTGRTCDLCNSGIQEHLSFLRCYEMMYLKPCNMCTHSSLSIIMPKVTNKLPTALVLPGYWQGAISLRLFVYLVILICPQFHKSIYYYNDRKFIYSFNLVVTINYAVDEEKMNSS